MCKLFFTFRVLLAATMEMIIHDICALELQFFGKMGLLSKVESSDMWRLFNQHARLIDGLQDGMVINESSSAPGGDAVTKTSKVHSDSTSQQCIPEHRLSDESNRVDKRTDCPSQNVGGRVGKKVTIRAWPEDDSTDRTENDAKDNNGSTFFLTQTSDA